MKALEQKIDGLSETVSGLSQTVTTLDRTVADLGQTVTSMGQTVADLGQTVNILSHTMTEGFSRARKDIDDLAAMTGRGFKELRAEFQGDLTTLRTDIAQDVDILLDKQMGRFYKEFDVLASRTKDLELATRKGAH